MSEIVIVSALRTAIGTFGGGLSSLTAAKLGEEVIRETLKRTGVTARGNFGGDSWSGFNRRARAESGAAGGD